MGPDGNRRTLTRARGPGRRRRAPCDAGMPVRGAVVLAALAAAVIVVIIPELEPDHLQGPGLNAGADDYLVKPFDLAELSARIGSVAGRHAGNPNPIVTHGALDIDLAARRIHKGGCPVALTARECDRDGTRPWLPAGPGMTGPRSLQGRLALWLGLALMVLWVAAASVTALLARLDAAFQAERRFAANAARELRTPLAGAIAQAQRLQAETGDAETRARAARIEVTLKRLVGLSERLLQLARAEGGRLQRDHPADLRPVVRMITEDLARAAEPGRITLSLPQGPILSDLDPDAVAILLRNLVDNALRHGWPDTPVEVALRPDGTLTVANEGPVLPPEVPARLMIRFERAGAGAERSGLGLAIVAAIAERTGHVLRLCAPQAVQPTGFEAVFAPADAARPAGQPGDRGLRGSVTPSDQGGSASRPR